MNQDEIRIKEIIKKIRPYLQADGGDVEYVSYENGIVYGLRFEIA